MKKIICSLTVLALTFNVFAVSASAKSKKPLGNVTEEKLDIPHEVTTTMQYDLEEAQKIAEQEKSSHIDNSDNTSTTLGDVTTQDLDLRWHTHRIENVRIYQINDYYPVTDWYVGSATIAYQQGQSFTISGSVNTTCGVSASTAVAQVKADTGVTIGASTTVTCSTTYTRTISSGYKGRIIYRYTYDYATFTCVKDYDNPNYRDEYGEGDGKSAAYDGYFTLQQVSL